MRFYNDKHFLLQQIIAAWVILFISVIIFATIATMVSLVTDDQSIILILTSATVIPILVLAHIIARNWKYTLPPFKKILSAKKKPSDLNQIETAKPRVKELTKDGSLPRLGQRIGSLAALTLIVLVLLIIVIQLEGPSVLPVTGEKEAPSKVEPIEGSEFSRLILTEKAAERIDVQTTPVSEEWINGVGRRVLPYAAVLYGLEGETWVYTNPEPLVYIRVPIEVDYIDGDWVALVEGPEVGTQVVTVGASLLYGAETGVSK